jgi:hypothetical protein
VNNILPLQQKSRGFRQELLARRDGARLHAGTLPSPNQLLCAETMMWLLSTAGDQSEEGFSILIGLSRFVPVSVMEEQTTSSTIWREWAIFTWTRHEPINYGLLGSPLTCSTLGRGSRSLQTSFEEMTKRDSGYQQPAFQS